MNAHYDLEINCFNELFPNYRSIVASNKKAQYPPKTLLSKGKFIITTQTQVFKVVHNYITSKTLCNLVQSILKNNDF